jgi:hypothetical protein
VSIVNAEIKQNDSTIFGNHSIKLDAILDSVYFSGALPSSVKKSDIELDYNFDGNYNDQSLNLNNAQNFGTQLVDDEFKLQSAAIEINNSNYLLVPNQLFSGNSAVNSLTFIVKFKINTLPSSGSSYTIFDKDSYWRRVAFGISSDGCIYIGGSIPYNYWGSTTIANQVIPGKYYELIINISNGNTSIYLNGKIIPLQSSYTPPLDFSTVVAGNSAGKVLIGRANPISGSWIDPFVGTIDYFKVLNRNLTATEIFQLKNRCFWSTGDTTETINVIPSKTTTYYCTVSNGISSCTDSVTIYVKNQIVSSSGANGSISPSGTTSVNSGSSQTYTFIPNPGFWIDSVIVNGVQIPTASSYTFSNVTSDQTIRVTYRSLAVALAAANICSNDTIVSTVNLPAQSNVRATTYYSNIYLFNQNNTGNAYKYNVNDRKYTAITNKPSPCIECGVAEANGKVYCFNTNGTTQAYDIATNTWQNQANQTSTSTSSVYAASSNNKIYVLGTNNNQNTFTQYNPQTNSYTALANPTTSSSQSKLVAYNNKLYKIGGTDNNSQPISSVEVYNPTNNTWTTMPDLPEALSQVGATTYDNKLYVFGGKQNSNTNSNSNKVYVFDFTSNAWYAESNTQNTNRTNIEAKTANNMVFLFGGTDTTNTQTDQAQRYFCKDQLCTCKWAEYVCNGVSQNEPCPIPTSSLYRPGTVFCNGIATKVVEVTNPITGKIWMDRNLGASRTAVSSTDTLAYGDLYQWGRAADGHQCRNSGVTSTLSSSFQPNHPNFILSNGPYDIWSDYGNDFLWQGVNAVNNPCPNGYRVPSASELDSERNSWIPNNSIGAFNSILKLPLSGRRLYSNGTLDAVGSFVNYWSSDVISINARYLYFYNLDASMGSQRRATGASVRCIKD